MQYRATIYFAYNQTDTIITQYWPDLLDRLADYDDTSDIVRVEIVLEPRDE